MNTVLIADHHPITGLGLEALLNDAQYNIIGRVATGNDLFKNLRSKVPDVLIMEIDLPQINGITALRTIKSEYPTAKIFIFSSYPEEMYALSAIKAGASAYLAKTASPETILQAVHQVARGGIFLNEKITQKLNSNPKNTGLVSRYNKLSTREIEVLNLLSSGKRNKDIALALSINEKTVSTYKTRLLKKLRIDNLADLINQSRVLQLK